MKPNWLDNLVYWYFMKRWKPIFKKDVRQLAVHVLELDKLRMKLPSRTQEYEEYYEEP